MKSFGIKHNKQNMMSLEKLNRCLDILAVLNKTEYNPNKKKLILELGYIIKEEYDLAKSISSNKDAFEENKINGQNLKIEYLLADNKRLFKENEILLNNLQKLTEIVNETIPRVKQKIETIGNKIDSMR